MHEKKIEAKTTDFNEMGMQNVIRKRHCKDWPNVILQLTKRITGVNASWAKIMFDILTIPGLSINIVKHDGKYDEKKKFLGGMLVSLVYIHPRAEGHVALDEVEEIEFTLREMQEGSQHVEVMLMDRINKSKLLNRLRKENGQ